MYNPRVHEEEEKYISSVLLEEKKKKKRSSSPESDLYSFVGSRATLQESFLGNYRGEKERGRREKSRLFKTRKSPWKGRFSGLHFSVTVVIIPSST